MTDQTTTEVTRVLREHSHYAPDARTQEELDGSNWECADCGHTFDVMFDGDPTSAMAAHQATMLAEAGLLRSYDPDAECGVCGGTRDRAEMWRRIANRMDYALAEMMPTLRKIFSDATENERQMLDAFDVLIEQARDGNGDPQIAASVPAGQPAAGSAGRGGSGGLDGPLSACEDDGISTCPKMAYSNKGLQREVERLTAELDQANTARTFAQRAASREHERADAAEAQVEAIRAAITREAAHGDAITRCNLVAERFQTVLDGVTKPETNENEGA